VTADGSGNTPKSGRVFYQVLDASDAVLSETTLIEAELAADYSNTFEVSITFAAAGTYRVVIKSDLGSADAQVSVTVAAPITYSAYTLSATGPSSAVAQTAANYSLSVTADGSGNTPKSGRVFY
jgi:hypothetical protein